MAKRYVLGPAGARKLRALFNGRGGSGSVRGSAAPLVFEDGFVPPFTVQWAASLAQGESSEGAGDATSGEWIIWLPPGDLLHVNGETVDVTANLEAAGDDYPEGWYVLSHDGEPILDRDEGGALYLSLSGEFSGGASGGAIKVCDASVDSETDARTVKQYISSSIIIGAGGAPMPFDLKGEVETNNDGTQKRLKVYFLTTGADVIWNGHRLIPNTNVNTGWDLAYVGEWASAESFTASATMWLWFETLFQQEFADGQWRCSFEGDWEVYEEANLSDLGQMGVQNDGGNYVEQNVPLGLVTASGDKVTVAQYFHGVLMLHDTSFIWSQDGGGGGGGGGGETTDTGCYAINSSNKLINQYFVRGGVVETTNFTDGLGEYSGKIVALKIAATPGGSVSLAAYDTIGELTAASQDPDYIVTPLYWLESDGKVKVDFRNAPRAQAVEIL